MRRIISILATLCVGVVAWAQPVDSIVNKQSPTLQYFFTVRSGALVGCRCGYQNPLAVAANTVQGLRWRNRWHVGFGSGIHSYTQWQVLPFVANVGVQMGKKRNWLLEYNFGGSHAWITDGVGEPYGLRETKGGRVTGPALVYQMAYHDLRVSLLVGFQSQVVTSRYEYLSQHWANGSLVDLPPSTREERMVFNRMLIQMGIGWK